MDICEMCKRDGYLVLKNEAKNQMTSKLKRAFIRLKEEDLGAMRRWRTEDGDEEDEEGVKLKEAK